MTDIDPVRPGPDFDGGDLTDEEFARYTAALREQRCQLAACRTCTGCAHGHHDECRRSVRCPTDRDIRTCGCCGVRA